MAEAVIILIHIYIFIQNDQVEAEQADEVNIGGGASRRSEMMARSCVWLTVCIPVILSFLIIKSASAQFQPQLYASVSDEQHDDGRIEVISVSALEEKIIALRNEDPYVRAEAAQDLSNFEDPLAAKHLIKALNDENPYVRAYAAESLGKIKDLVAIAPLIQLLNDDEPFVRSYVAESLGELKAREAVEPLITIMHGTNKDVGPSVAWALGVIKDTRAERPLINALNTGDRDLRISAARALGMIRSSHAVEPLISALRSECCFEAAEALKQITGLNLGAEYAAWNSWWNNIGN